MSLDTITELFNTLSIIAENEATRLELKAKIKYKGNIFREKEQNEKQKKLENLRIKYLNDSVDRPQKPQKPPEWHIIALFT